MCKLRSASYAYSYPGFYQTSMQWNATYMHMFHATSHRSQDRFMKNASTTCAELSRFLLTRYLSCLSYVPCRRGHRDPTYFLKGLKQTPFHSFYLAGSFLHIRPAFAATISKSRGQTMQRMSLYLPSPVFSHGTTICCALSRFLSFLYQNTTKMSPRLWRSHINTKGMTGNRTSCAIWLQPSLYPQH